MPRFLRWSLWLFPLTLLTSCFPVGNPDLPIPTAMVPATGHAERLVVVLPGRGDDLSSLRKRGLAEIIQQAWPDSDVELTGLTMGYYRAGNATQRLHDEVIAPARQRGYRQVWLLGISLGGLGSVLYDRQYPGDVHGMILIAPYLGEGDIHQQIIAAGGVRKWNPGPPHAINSSNFPHELWAQLHVWAVQPAKAPEVWLGFGADDRFRDGMDLMVPLLPPDHVLVLPGKHNWNVWRPVARQLLRNITRAGVPHE